MKEERARENLVAIRCSIWLPTSIPLVIGFDFDIDLLCSMLDLLLLPKNQIISQLHQNFHLQSQQFTREYRKFRLRLPKTVAPVLPKTATRKSTTDDSMDRKRATPRSLKELIYSSPDKESENKMTTPAATGRRIESSRVAPSPYKASKDCNTPLRTPIVASANGVSKHPSTTPCS
ncbi:hypothetical protein TEA_009063 [Camellia sinensis var. sinensis]|uniref:Uncharacterized protein n=1 Tax=Camellia sinensis var. sinensis TaxID=542762 RepID=A0A4S4DK38_CAMSN|nr:hypothetical protein TEA_009063 [Camellia sinensis var. sinensis]